VSWIISYACRKYADHEDISVFKNTTLLYATGAALLATHLFFLFYFLYVGLTPMIAVNTLSCAVYAGVLALVRAGMHKSACAVITVEVAAYSVIATVCFGPNVDAQDFIIPVILAQYLVFEFKQAPRLSIAVGLSLLWYGLIFVSLFYAPPYIGYAGWALRRINVVVVVFFILFEMILNMLAEQTEKAFYSRKITKITEESHIDPLTRLKNRRYADNIFFDRLLGEADVSSPRDICFAMIDIDHFKVINDKYGHDGGDEVLKAFAEILRRNLRATDLVCRWGGEEFLVVMLDCDLNYARMVIAKVQAAAAGQPVEYNGAAISFAFTAGLCMYDGGCVADTIRKCDEKLYEGKNAGRNRIVS